jgi:hypothetical protein
MGPYNSRHSTSSLVPGTDGGLPAYRRAGSAIAYRNNGGIWETSIRHNNLFRGPYYSQGRAP